MPASRLAVPKSPHTKVFDALTGILKGNPLLRSAARVRSPEGNPTDTSLVSFDMTPLVDLSPSIGPTTPFGPQGVRADLIVTITLYVPGTRTADLMDLWHAVAKAIFPDDADERLANQSALTAAGAVGHWLLDYGPTGFTILDADSDNPFLKASLTSTVPVEVIYTP